MLQYGERQDAARSATVKSIYVYEAPVRLWHWVNALAITVLAVTGYFIGSPLPTMSGEASDHFVMGYIRFAHFAAGYVVAIGLLVRIYWAFVGNAYARELFLPPFFTGQWWRELLHEIRWYAFLAPYPLKYAGHNPLAQLMMFMFFVVGVVFMIVTGFALYGEGLGQGSWADTMFGWVIPLFGQSQDVHTWHHLGMWAMATFVILHVYAAIREDVASRQSLVSTMVSGFRMFKD
ncbi:MAG: Ni/Fe-hydrogenase, b-type cytochrome subunit [Steroidobacteraceae bacterium]|jgi:Ni/Fe-hydrogenase 1 B-type cytochrome subunit|nr:Ni/Fe-hydrogenase, b-type cytochrome subunit [Steroidobacteraceae bacterium]